MLVKGLGFLKGRKAGRADVKALTYPCQAKIRGIENLVRAGVVQDCLQIEVRMLVAVPRGDIKLICTCSLHTLA